MVNFELFNDVGAEDGITVDGVRSFLNANKKEDIQFDISTLGGDLATALTIYDLIKAHPGQTKANIIGLTASAGTVIAMACDYVEISPNSLFLIHNGWREVTGNVYDLQKAASDLMRTDAIMIRIYKEKTGLDENKIKDLMKASDWLTPTEAFELGFVNQVGKSELKIAASVMLTVAKGKINEQLLIKLEKKMKLFGKKSGEKADVVNILALKDGKQLLINAEAAGTGVEVAPLGAVGLEDGEYELMDGRTIIVTGGVITEVKEAEIVDETDEGVVAAITEVVTSAIAKVKAEIQEEFKAELAKISSTHKPPKGTISTGGKAKVDVISNVNEVANGIRKKIEESRKA